jgi:phosphotransacetylase
MVIHDFRELKGHLMQTDRKTVVVAGAHNTHTLEAVFRAYEDGVIRYLLIGNEEKIRQKAEQLGHQLTADAIIDIDDLAECGKQAVACVKQGRGDFLLKGKLSTAQLLSAVVDKKDGIRKNGLLSHVSILQIKKYSKLLGITDAAMVIRPDLEQKKEILNNAVKLFRYLGYEEPKAAVLAAVEVENPKMPETLDAARLKKMAVDGEIRNC